MRSTLLAIAVAAGLSSQAVVPTSVETSTQPDQSLLRFRPDGTFKVSIFSDTHLAMCAWHWGCLLQDKKGVEVIGKVLDAEKPDFAVFNGDLINADSAFKHNASLYIDQLVKPLVDRGLPWGSTYGNHDHAFQLDGDVLLAREQTHKGCRTKRMVPGEVGVTNYYIPVYPAGCKHGKDTRTCSPELIMWFFDSRGGSRSSPDGKRLSHENFVHVKVVEWFQQTNMQLRQRYGKVIPAVGFVHIPPVAILRLQQEKGVDKNKQPGINDERASPQGQGYCPDGHHNPDKPCDYGMQDTPFMNAITNVEGFMALFSGHDHANSWCHKWNEQLPGMNVKGNGIHLCFGQHTGYGGYGNWIRGGRELVFDKEHLKKFELNTHIRLESGAVVGAISLNSTYGEDMYPETPNDKTYL